MSSLTTDKSGNRNIRFADPNGARRCIYLGKMPLKACQRIQGHIERLASSAISGEPVADETARWLSKLDDVLRGKLVRVGLVKARESVGLADFIGSYIDGRHDAKESTRVNWRKVRRMLTEYFDGSRSLRSITPSEAKDFRQHLIASEYADNTTRKVCSVVRQFFTDAVERGLIESNPFDQKCIPTSTGGNPARQAYVSIETAEAVLNACPDSEWRLLFALSRFAGLRTPREPLALRWGDVNWETKRMLVHSCKTARYEGKSTRIVPIFTRLRPYLEAAFDEAEPGTEYVINGRGRDTGVNLRKRMMQIIGQAGVAVWPKLFNNLRSSAVTDLLKEHPLKTVCEWMGHSPKIALQHYAQSREVDFEEATKLLPQSIPVSDGNPRPTADTVSARHGKTLEPRVLPRQMMTEAGLEPARPFRVSGF